MINKSMKPRGNFQLLKTLGLYKVQHQYKILHNSVYYPKGEGLDFSSIKLCLSYRCYVDLGDKNVFSFGLFSCKAKKYYIIHRL
jgi:hypothetical protein